MSRKVQSSHGYSVQYVSFTLYDAALKNRKRWLFSTLSACCCWVSLVWSAALHAAPRADAAAAAWSLTPRQQQQQHCRSRQG